MKDYLFIALGVALNVWGACDGQIAKFVCAGAVVGIIAALWVAYLKS